MKFSLINKIRTATIQQLCFIAFWEICDFKVSIIANLKIRYLKNEGLKKLHIFW